MSDKSALRQEALDRAQAGQAVTNYPAIYSGFLARGIPEADIRPRENVFTYNAWKALGRQVRRGEHGVKVVTFVPVDKKNESGEVTETYRRPWSATVFHVSQTDPAQ